MLLSPRLSIRLLCVGAECSIYWVNMSLFPRIIVVFGCPSTNLVAARSISWLVRRGTCANEGIHTTFCLASA